MRLPEWILLLVTVVLLAGCRTEPAQPPPTATPLPEAAVSGVLLPSGDANGVGGRAVGLCRADLTSSFAPSPCELLERTAITDEQGRFHFTGLQPGSYFVVYTPDGGPAALAAWAGQTLRPGNWTWLHDTYLELDDGQSANVWPPASLPDSVTLDRGAYGGQTLMLAGSPLVLGHEIHKTDGTAQAMLVTASAPPGGTATVTLPLLQPQPPDLEAVRVDPGPLTRQELPLVDRALAARWSAFIDGDDTAYRDTDAAVIRALRSGGVHRIGGAVLTAVEALDNRLVKAVGYWHIDVQSGEGKLVGWYDPATGDVQEVRTGYRLNVRDDTGIWTEAGAEGEQLYHYGYSYYRRWDQLLPDPVILLVNDFYGEGSAHMWRHVAQYQEVKRSFGGDLSLLDWDNRTLTRIQAWTPAFPPFVRLPDSGTVDINRDRFLRAVIDGRVQVDGDSVDAFLASDVATNGTFDRAPDRQAVIDALLIPYRSGHLYTDLEAAIILDATYGGSAGEPLTVVISDRLAQGFQVPRYRDKVVYVSRDEVANVLLGYPGALNSRWPHEMGHIVDFRSEQYAFTSRPPVGSRCEPVKYLMEYMWWVRRYPGDAPDWDWMPINSGLTLARLLTDSYHNSGC